MMVTVVVLVGAATFGRTAGSLDGPDAGPAAVAQARLERTISASAAVVIRDWGDKCDKGMNGANSLCARTDQRLCPPRVEYYFARYGDLELHRRMIADRWRTEAFARAIRQAVKPGEVVLDVGTGTGILAMLCASAGAEKVYGVDQSPIAQTAANLVKANGLQDRVKILRGPASEVALDEPVDLLVSEWLGHMAFVENMLDDVIEARDRNLSERGRMLPADVDLRLAPVGDPVLFFQFGPGFWRRKVQDLDFSSLERLELEQGRAWQTRIEQASLLAESASITRLDLKQCARNDPFGAGQLVFEIHRDGMLDGFAGWFTSELAPGITLDTSPRNPETHWSQTYFPFAPRAVRAGEEVTVEFGLARDPEEPRHLKVSLHIGDEGRTYTVE